MPSNFRFERLDRIQEASLLELAEEFREEGDDRFDGLLEVARLVAARKKCDVVAIPELDVVERSVHADVEGTEQFPVAADVQSRCAGTAAPNINATTATNRG